METTMQRKVHLDLLRILATIAVVLIHVSTLHYYDFDPRSFGWLSINFYDALARWGVPVFVMISGALFLDSSRVFNVRRLFGKNVVRLLTAFVFWSLIYAAFSAGNWSEFWQRLFSGSFHMWFVLMMAGLYMLIPIFRKITPCIKTAEYYLLIAFFAVFLIPELLQIPALSALQSPMNNLLSTLSVGYGAYFIGGWYLSQKDFNKRQRVLIYILGVAGLLGTILGTSVISYRTGKAMPDPFFNYFSVEVMLEAMALFVFAKHAFGKRAFGARAVRWIAALSQYSFGAYLAHILVLNMVQRLGLRVTSFSAIVSVPLLTAVVYAGSMTISAILHRIPWLQKYAV